MQALLQHKIPVVALDRELKGMRCDSIVVDNQGGGRQATLHLIGGNHRRIGCISGPRNLTSAKERLQGYQDALAEARLPVDPALIQMGNFHIEGGYTAVQTLLNLPNPVTAVFAANDLMAVGALRGIAARGLRVPEDIAVVGFDDIALAMYTEPPLTTVKQPIREIGKLATELIMARVNGERKEPQSHRLKTSLIVLGSCGIKLPVRPRPNAKKPPNN